ncbi:tetratricopeptide repeat protein [Azospirillum sp. sgz301742]
MTHSGEGFDPAEDPAERGRRLRRDGDLHGALDAFREALAGGAGDPELLFETAGLLRSLEMDGEALAVYDALVLALPDLLPVLHNRAGCLAALGRQDEAVAAFAAVLARWPDVAPSWAGLGDAAFAAGDGERGRRALRTAIALEPERTGSYVNLGEGLASAGDDAGAVQALTRAALLTPDDPAIHYNLARSLLPLHRFAEGWAEFEWRLHPETPNSVARAIPCPRWSGEPLAGRHLYICGEMGIGDQIWFLPFVREAAERAAAVTLDVTPKLVPLVRQSLPGVTVRPLQVERPGKRWHAVGDSRCGPADADVYIELGSLPRFLWDAATRRAHVPVLAPDPAAAQRWRARLEALGPGPWIGLCWRSSLITPGRAIEYRPLPDWAPVLSGLRGRGTFVSLQHGDVRDELAQLHETFGLAVHPLPDLDLRDGIQDTAAAVASLDLVVSAGTWIAMLGGALGVPTLVASSFRWVGLSDERDPIHRAREPVLATPARPWPAGVMAEVAARAPLRL